MDGWLSGWEWNGTSINMEMLVLVSCFCLSQAAEIERANKYFISVCGNLLRYLLVSFAWYTKIYGSDHHLKWQFIVWHILIVVMDYSVLLCWQQKSPKCLLVRNGTEASIWECDAVRAFNKRNDSHALHSQIGGASRTQRTNLNWLQHAFNSISRFI